MEPRGSPAPAMMMSSGDFNVPVAAALVLSGIAALLLATFIALGGYGRSPAGGNHAAAASSAALAPSTVAVGGAATEAEVQYLLDTSP